MSVVRQWAKRLYSHRNKNMAGWQTAVLGRLPLCSDLRCLSGLNCTLCHIRSSQRVDNSHVPCGAVSWMPRYQSQTIGPFPSSLLRPSGSFDDGISALMRARWIKSLMWTWRCNLPGCFLHDKACWPRESTVAPQGHVWVSHIALPIIIIIVIIIDYSATTLYSLESCMHCFNNRKRRKSIQQ